MDSSGYSNGLERAQKSLDKYIDKNMSLSSVMSSAAATIGKVAGVVGLAMGAQEAFDRVMRGSQTTSDEYDRVMRSVNTTIDTFFTAISTGDFTSFNLGLSSIIEKARAANDALDQLGNTTMSYGYFNAKNQADFAEQIAILRDGNATQEAKDVAKKRIDEILKDQREITDQYAKRSMEAISAMVVEGNSLNASQISRERIDEVLRLDVQSSGDEEKKNLAKRYQEYVRVYNSLKKKYTTSTTMSTSAGVITQEVVDTEKLERAMQNVNNKYLDAITYNEVLVKKNDDWLKNLIAISNGADNAERSLAGMVKTYNRAAGSGNGNKGNGGSAKPKVKTAFEETKWSGQTLDQEIKLAISRTSDNVLSDEVYKAIEGDKRLPVLIQPVQALMEMENTEAEGMDEDPILDALRRKQEMYNISQNEIEKYTSLLAYANEEERGYLEEQISIWGNYANSINNVSKAGDGLSAISGTLGIMGSALQSTGNDWVGMLGSAASATGSLIQLVEMLTAAKSGEAIAEQAGKPWPANLIAIASTVAAITSAMASIKGIGGFAEGGIVPGTNYQDGITARVSSGEMFINEADQKRLYDAIHTGDFGGGSSGRTVVTAEQLVTVINNYGKRTGKGIILKG